MTTKSRIGIMNEDTTITSVYCHWDGYPSYNGRILYENYNTEEKIRELLSYGDLSSLGEDITNDIISGRTKCKFYNKNSGNETIKTYENIYEYEINGVEYNYLFMNGKWYYNTFMNPDFMLLTKQVIKEEGIFNI